MSSKSYLLYLLATSPCLAWAESPPGHERFGQVPGQNFGIPGQNASFDYIVVGGGTGGLAIASRLAESGGNSVAVVEAGGFYEQESGNTSVVPAYSVKYDSPSPEDAHQFPLVDWGIVTEPEEGLGGRRLHYARGKTLGGSSAFHGMVYNRGTIGSYQAWADLVGDESWTFENLLPYFARGVEYHGENVSTRASNASVSPPANPDAYNATGGPLQLSFPKFVQTFSSYADDALRDSGFPDQQDFNSGHLLGRQYATASISYPEAERSSSESSFLQAALQSGRDNLKVYTHTLAKRVLFDGNNTATGVELHAGSYGNTASFNLQARKEVVLSAGVFQSPQLLMVSGVGPRAQLEANNIKVLADRPGVGTNMQDHLDIAITYYINLQGGYGAISDPSANGPLTEEYIVNRTGPLTAPNVDYIGWDKLPDSYRQNLSASALDDLAQYPADWPEVEYEVSGATLAGYDPSKRYGSMVVVPVTPMSRGWVNITSNSTIDMPVVNPNQLSHPTDREVAVQVSRISVANEMHVC